MNLQNEQTQAAYNLWKNQFPHSEHNLDDNRFYNLALTLLENEDAISENEIEVALDENVTENKVSNYFEKFKVIEKFYGLMLDRGYTK